MRRSATTANPKILTDWQRPVQSGASTPDRDGSRCLSRLSIFPHPSPEHITQLTAILKDVVNFFSFQGCGLLALDAADTEGLAVYYCLDDGLPVVPSGSALRQLFPWTHQNLLEGNVVCFSSPSELPSPAALDRLQFEAAGVRRYVAVPVEIGSSVHFCLVAYGSEQRCRPGSISLLRLVAEILVMSLLGQLPDADPEMRLERLLCRISGRLINVSGELIDQEIKAALEQVRALAGFDRFGLATFSAENEIKVTHAAYENGISPLPANVDLSPLFPWASIRLLHGEPVHFASVEELPIEAATDRQSWQALGVKTQLVLPIAVGGSPRHLLLAAQVRANRPVHPALLPPCACSASSAPTP